MKQTVVLAGVIAAAAILAVSCFIAPAAASAPTVATSTPVVVPEPERNIKYYADLYGVDYSLAKSIARCESRFDPTVDNPYSSASGLYQFLDGTWRYYGKLKWGSKFASKDVYDYGDNAELAIWVMSKYGTKDWNASAHCWA